MLNRIKETRRCLANGLYEGALALSLTLPDICGQVEYPTQSLVGKRYCDWINKYVDKAVLCDPFFDGFNIEALTAADIYKLRCSFLHSGDDDIKSTRIHHFELVAPETLGKDSNGKFYGYSYRRHSDNKNQYVYTARINIVYLCEMICDCAEQYYNVRKPEDFEDHIWTLR